MNHHRAVFFFTIALMVMPGLARAQSFAPSAERGLELLAALDLTVSQIEKSKSMLVTARKRAIRMRADLEIAGIDLNTEFDKDVPDERIASTLMATMSSLEGQLRKSRVVTWIRILKLLNLQQRGRLKRLRDAEDRNMMKSRGELIDPFEIHDSVARRDLEASRLRNPFEQPPSRSPKKANRQPRSQVNIATDKAAKIFIDGKRMGVSPLSVRLRPGRHRVRSVFLDGSAPVVRIIKVKPDTNMMIHLK